MANNNIEDKKIRAIFEQVTFCPKRLFTVYFYFEEQIQKLNLQEEKTESCIKTLKQLLGMEHLK